MKTFFMKLHMLKAPHNLRLNVKREYEKKVSEI